MADRHWAIIVHGGARTIAPDRIVANRNGCAAAAAAGAAILERGGGAVEAARVAVCMLEDDPTFNAGRGSVANAAGEIEMDAGIMDGETLAIGAVAAVHRLHNPVEAAAEMLDQVPVLLVGKGAEAFARSRGLPVASKPLRPVPAEAAGHDTVGCVAFDRAGHLAAATSTGGLAGTLSGRVGDAPLPGGGFYADDAIGAVSLSGDGEAIARMLVGARVMRAMEDMPAPEAVRAIRAPLQRLGAEAGVIAIDARGRIGLDHNSDHFAVAFASADRELVAITHSDEWTGE
ncbi:beta-aspartyl-peptidase (threonine type) [Sphingopyxis sp. OAS728]|uniref:isoaspartyl peptidase/L-asparaginase family protein n=1 Tax=Sphingopyxis sp. OAS728 TaxID=2663823 RepID=UPI00178B37FF|nr:isoaspartyl peptidase/L-asparaginase family protein [Sphingopyxis sp. OAS728]MBE1529467.1 beta-aspartyl-peptidase (threonine type) [Sphingopyxis sp. OAS728]